MSDTGKAIDRSSTHRRGIFRTDLLVVCDACGRDFERPASERTCGLVIRVRLTRETENENLGAVESFSLRIELPAISRQFVRVLKQNYIYVMSTFGGQAN